MVNKYTFSIIFIIYGDLLISSIGSPLIGENVKPAEKNEFPFVVSLGHFAASKRSERYLNHFCGGSLITQRHVLTAAHCLLKKKPLAVVVTVGNVNLNEGKMYTVESWITFNEWMMDHNNVPEFSSNDIAVVTLSNNITDIVPAVRSNLLDAEIFGREAVIAGWGLINNYLRTQFLQKAYVRVLTMQECKRNVLMLFGCSQSMPLNHYCTSAEPPVILTRGDSGGPLILSDTREIVGINEATCNVKDAATHCYATSIHLKVNYFREFIDDVLNMHG